MSDNPFEGEMPLDAGEMVLRQPIPGEAKTHLQVGPLMNERVGREQAEDLIRSGRHEDAWNLLDSLPSEDRQELSAVRMRLICAMATQRFETADELARYLGTGAEAEAHFASPVLQDLARIQLHSGSREYAHDLAVAAINAHPERRFEIIYDPTLKALF
jgi:hypothetical protein